MVKILLIEVVDNSISTSVLLVAIETGLAAHKTVEMFSDVDVSFDFLVAIKTLRIRNTTTGFVTFQAVFML